MRKEGKGRLFETEEFTGIWWSNKISQLYIFCVMIDCVKYGLRARIRVFSECIRRIFPNSNSRNSSYGKHIFSWKFGKTPRPRPTTLLKKRLLNRCFSYFPFLYEFLRAPLFTKHIRLLLLNVYFPWSFLEFLEHLYFIAPLASSPSIEQGTIELRVKHLCRSLFLSKTASWRSAILLKRDSSTGAFL